MSSLEELMSVVAEDRLVRWGYDKLEGEAREQWLGKRMEDKILQSDIKAILLHLDKS